MNAMGRTLVLAAAAFASAAFAADAQAKKKKIAPSRKTLVSHRGESVDAPENTLPAFKTAVSRGFGFECDVYLSKDGRVFTFHDGNLERTTAGASKKKCSEANWKGELENIDVGAWGKWKGSKFEGTRPALLEEVLKLAKKDRYIYIEVKPGPEIVPYIKKIVDAQKKATPKNILFISFNSDTCKAIKEQMGEYKVYWITSSRYGAKDAKGKGSIPVTAEYIIDTLKRIGADGVDCHFSKKIVTKELVQKVRSAGFEFHVWTVDTLDNALEAFKRGVQTVTTNRALGLLDEYKARKAAEKGGDKVEEGAGKAKGTDA